MTEKERYLKAKEIFLQAVETNPNARERYIAWACGSDQVLHQEVMRLLRADFQAGDTWEETIRVNIAAQLNTNEPTDFPPFPIGEIFGERYFIQKELGRGGIGAVYLAVDNKMYLRPVVIKLLLDNSSRHRYLVDKFEHEAESLIRIKHPGVVSAIDLGKLRDGKPYLVMEFLEGKMLADEIRTGAMDFKRAAVFIRQIAQALFAAHFEKVVHRDLKPTNVMIQYLSGGTKQAKLIDFGIAKVENPQSANATQTPVTVGTPPYIAPEQLERREASPKSDIYALGVISYEMLTGYRPFTVDTTSLSWVTDLINLQRNGMYKRPKERRADLPDTVQEEIEKALLYNPEHRHQTAFEFGERLYRALTKENHIEPTTMDLDTLTLEASQQPTDNLTFNPSESGKKTMNKAVRSFERLWSHATFTDRIRPLPPASAREERQQLRNIGEKPNARGMGAKPKRAQYTYRLGSELCLVLDIGGKPNVRGLGAKPKRDGYLILLDGGPEGIVYCLCPSLFAPNTRLYAGRIYLPQAGSPYEAFELSGVAGKEKLLAIISDEPLGLDWLSKDAETPARVLSDEDIESLFARLQQLGEGRWTALSSYFEVVA